MSLSGVGNSPEMLVLRLEQTMASMNEAALSTKQESFEAFEESSKKARKAIDNNMEEIRDKRGDLIAANEKGPEWWDTSFLQGQVFKTKTSMDTAEIAKQEAVVETHDAQLEDANAQMTDLVDSMSDTFQQAKSSHDTLEDLTDEVQRLKSSASRI
jgi:chromosome segregation ATPase